MPFQFEPAPRPGKLTREQTRAAYERHLLAKGAIAEGDWEKNGERFAEGADCFDALYGWIHGRAEITRFLRDSMKGLEDWTYPVQWVLVDEGRVVVHWLNRLPGRRADGTHYEFAGLSAITFDDEGLIVRQIDMYDSLEAFKTVFEAKLGPLGTPLRRLVEWPGAAFLGASRALYDLLEKKTAKAR